MGSLRGAINHLASIAFTGATKNYDVDELPSMLGNADLPALAPRLLDTRGGQDTQAATVLTYDGGKYWATYYLEHVCYWTPTTSGKLSEFTLAMVNFIDVYVAKVALNGKMNGQLDEWLDVVTVDINQYGYPKLDSGTMYWAIRFLHRWKIEVTAA